MKERLDTWPPLGPAWPHLAPLGPGPVTVPVPVPLVQNGVFYGEMKNQVC